MLWWQAVILGIVEGITEYLPISSTGHLIITSAFLGLDQDETAKGAVDAFNIVIQGGAILAVLGLYRERILQMLKGLVGADRDGRRLLINLIIAFIPAVVLGLALNDLIEALLFFPLPVAVALVVGGVYMLLVERWRRGRSEATDDDRSSGLGVEDLTPLKALFIGFMQCIAMWPGTSRSMMTITGGVFVGLRPAAAAEFSFLLGLPTLGGAMCLTLFKDYLATRDGEASLFAQLGVSPVLIGIAVATVSAAIAVRWLVSFLNTHGLAPFGWYRIVFGLVLVGLILTGVIAG